MNSRFRRVGQGLVMTVCRHLLLLITSGFFVALPGNAYCQTPQPSPPAVNFTNSVNFDLVQKKFNFNYQGTDGNLSYKYTASSNGSLSALQCIVNGTYTFTPSLGGITMAVGSNEIFPWTSGVSFELQNVNASADTLFVYWKMKSGFSSLLYNYKFFISARTLVVDVTAQSPTAPQFTLDRCENVLNPKIIPVPYLTSFNVLYTNGAFVSMFFDWEHTEASELLPEDAVFSQTSVRFSHNARYLKKTNGARNLLNEKIYLTASPSFADVLPNLPNPVSPYKTVSSNHLVFDSWHYNGFSNALNEVKSCFNAGIKNLWLIVHDWQFGGYDNMFPDVMPANPAYGGNADLKTLSAYCAKRNYLFSLHENYFDFYSNAPSFTQNDLAKNSDGSFKLSWYNPITSIQANQMKPSKSANYLGIFSPQINQTYSTTASYLDVHTAANPSYAVDYDAAVPNSGSLKQTVKLYRQLAALQKINHSGPASGEGNSHFLYAGYYDDIEGQINTGKQSGYWQGMRLPLLVDFQLNKIHPLMCTHGVGYYERFFSKNDGTVFFRQFPLDTTLIYIATELAYGNAGFIPFRDRVKDILAVSKLEYKHVLPAQQLYVNANAVSITYDDNGQLVDASQYIKNHPATFDDIASVDFMGKVKVVYDNGTVVYVNRHPAKTWNIIPGIPGGSVNYHAIINSKDSLGVNATTSISNWKLPSNSGWLVISPQQTTGIFSTGDSSQSIMAYPNPSNGNFTVQIEDEIFADHENVQIDICNVIGERVHLASITRRQSQVEIDLTAQPGGIYILFIKTAKGICRQKLIIQK